MIYLMRHGETVWNVQRRLQGRRDSPLTGRGVEQARAFGRALKRLGVVEEGPRIVASPLGRAWQTAVLATEEMGLDPGVVVHDDRLLEHSFGLWEGLLWQDVERDHAASLKRRMADKWNAPAPEGESYSDVARRVAGWLEDATPNETTLVFCHGVTARVLRGVYAGLDQATIMSLPEPQDRIFALADGGIRELSVTSP